MSGGSSQLYDYIQENIGIGVNSALERVSPKKHPEGCEPCDTEIIAGIESTLSQIPEVVAADQSLPERVFFFCRTIAALQFYQLVLPNLPDPSTEIIESANSIDKTLHNNLEFLYCNLGFALKKMIEGGFSGPVTSTMTISMLLRFFQKSDRINRTTPLPLTLSEISLLGNDIEVIQKSIKRPLNFGRKMLNTIAILESLAIKGQMIGLRFYPPTLEDVKNRVLMRVSYTTKGVVNHMIPVTGRSNEILKNGAKPIILREETGPDGRITGLDVEFVIFRVTDDNKLRFKTQNGYC
jgi:hypothetical protein